jgi:wyosine [tRNA(Phe)-imidazoG37] synthetase (radical SAM superfamily)
VQPGKDKKNKLNDIMNMSDENVIEYVKIIEKANPNFVHAKGFMSIGHSRPRGMTYDKQPTFDEVKEYAGKILVELQKKDKKWKMLAEEIRSVVVVLGRDKKEMKIRKV